MAAPPVALVFGGDVTALAVLRPLGRAGVEALVPGVPTALARRSRYYRRAPGSLGAEASGEALAAYLRGLPFERSVLFPCSDHWAVALAALPEDVTRAHRPVVAPRAALEALVDKARFGEATAAHGVPAPRTLRARGPEDLDALSDEELRGSFLKPVDSQAFAAQFGVKGLRLHDRAQAAERLAEVGAAGHEVVVQEYIPGPPSAHVFVDGLVDRAGELRACLARRRLRFLPPFGNSTLSESVPLEDAGSAVASLQRLFAGIGFTGLFDAEFKRDARDGEFKAIEVNARPWWQLPLTTAAGLDVVVAAYRDAAGLLPRELGGYRVGVRWVHPVPDLRAWWAGRRDPEQLGGSPLRAWPGAANAVFSADDPLPVLSELAFTARGAAKVAWRRLSRH
jgi:D-aspartate ligase